MVKCTYISGLVRRASEKMETTAGNVPFLAVLKDGRRLKAACKGVEPEVIREAINVLLQELALRQEREKRVKPRVLAFLEELDAAGLQLDDLLRRE